jgi:conjugative relaxase-like TrwC/TraI family protein
MINISRPIGSETINTYYHEKYTMGDYYTQSSTLHGHWFGIEAEALGLVGQTEVRDFERLMSGRRPDARFDLEQLTPWEREGSRFLVRDKETNTVQAEVHKTRNGWVNDQLPEKRYKSAQAAKTAAVRELSGLEIHYRQPEKARRAWDIVSRPGKSVSVAAVVGGDKRIIEAHRRANAAMLRAIQQLIQARGGGDNPAMTTGRFVVARFEHYTARPEEVETMTGEKILYPAALLHTHNVMANWTRTPEGKIRSIDTSELFRFQAIGKAVYQAHMAKELRMLGYQIEFGKNGSPGIAGYTKEYLESESLRSISIQKQMEELGLDGAYAASLIAERMRNGKLELTEEQTAALHRANDTAHGNQNARIIGEALARSVEYARR